MIHELVAVEPQGLTFHGLHVGKEFCPWAMASPPRLRQAGRQSSAGIARIEVGQTLAAASQIANSPDRRLHEVVVTPQR